MGPKLTLAVPTTPYNSGGESDIRPRHLLSLSCDKRRDLLENRLCQAKVSLESHQQQLVIHAVERRGKIKQTK